ncbi:uncharacterized protein [Mytilus edulis]|uniref:uncharacterized protein isoform X2 n=1 Tax=Mytilus edulis TaxID=6550 RepID=UPI0039EECB29
MEKNKKQTKKSPYQKIDLEHVFSYLQTNEYPPDDRYSNRIHRSNLRQRALDFIIENGKLYSQPFPSTCDNTSDTDRQKSDKKSLKRLVLFSNDDKLQAFYECHISKEGQHHGKNRTVALCKDKYYFLCMIEMVKLLIRNCPICSSRLDTTNIITMEQENDMEILNMLYGEKHGNVSSPSLELSSICKNEIQTVHETDQECPMKQNSADEKSCIMSNEPDKERNEENERVLENMDNNGVEICNLESNEEPDYFWHSVELCIFGPYECQGRQKYVIIFLDLYSMWPEVTIVDTISPAIITMGLLDLICRYNVMKRLYLRNSTCGGLSLITPDVHLLQSADIHIDIVKKDVHYTEHIWTLLKNQISSFIKNNSDWPCTLSFAIMPFRISYDDDDVDENCTLFISRRQKKKSEDRFPKFDSKLKQVLSIYRYCSNKSVKPGDKNDNKTTDIITEGELGSASENLADLTKKSPFQYFKDNPETTKVSKDNEIVKSPHKMTTRNKRIDYCSLSSDKHTTDSFKTKKRKVLSVGTISEHTKKLKPVSNKKKLNHEDVISYNCKSVENQKESLDDSLVLEHNFSKVEDQATCDKNGPVDIKDIRTEHSENYPSKIHISKEIVNPDIVKTFVHEESHGNQSGDLSQNNSRTVEEIKDNSLTRYSKQQVNCDKDGKIYTCSTEAASKNNKTNSQGRWKNCKTKKLIKAQRRSLTCLCSTCGKTVKSFSLKSHLKMHSNPKRLECPHCFKGFFTEADLTAHINNRHAFISPSLFSCTVCNQVFTRKGSLKRHEQSRHQNLKLYQCDKCGKRFHRKHYLTSHHKICQQTVKEGIQGTSSQNGIRKDNLKQRSKASAKGVNPLITNHKKVHRQNLNKKTNAVNKLNKETCTKPVTEQNIDLNNIPHCSENDLSCIVDVNKSNVQEITHCVMYETESGTEYHIISDDPNKPIDTDTIAAIQMLASLKEKGQ